ncbi:glycosyltransferase family 4 protein [Cohnella pontilimi]|uniref:Glycosyltransferase family 4 protein n=1 Tax=Cohnella pontilimi TaxID=2564100 RepID=A0A4U0FG18_9BACL|nr:glycosyltransferase family 4 protein [Cohnella pontilimi]TJY43936.1 glycosyltransferase family 4 protein [Cohnella pontilimi]
MTKRRSPYIWVMTREYPPIVFGGVGTVAAQLTKAFIRSNMTVNVVTKSATGSIHFSQQHGSGVLRIPEIKPYFHGFAYQTRFFQRAADRYFSGLPDIIHVHSIEFAAAALWYKRKYRIPVVYTCHSLISNSRKNAARKKSQNRLFRHADRITVPSMWLKRSILKEHAAAASKVSVIPHGVQSVSDGTKIAPLHLLFVGRIIKSKGIEPLIRSISILSARNKRVRLTVIGKGSAQYEQRLRTIASKAGVSRHIRWLGHLPHAKVQRLYSSYGAVVVPSQNESFCLVALEAMANGIPLVSTRAGGLKQFVNTTNARTIRSVDSQAISRAITAMWQDPNGTRQRAANAKRLAKRYSWPKRAMQYEALFDTLLKARRRAGQRVKA